MMVMLFMMMAAAAMLPMLMMVMLFMMMAVTAAAAVMFLFMTMSQFFQMGSQTILTSHGIQNLLAIQLGPGGSDQCSFFIVLTNQLHSGIQLGLGNIIGTGQNNGTGSFDLIVVELAKVLHIDLHLAGIRHSNRMAQNHIFRNYFLHSCYHITELAHTGGLNHYAVRMILFDHLGQSLAKVAHQAAANAAGVHFRNVDAGILQETAVNTDLTEFIFDQYQLLTLVSFLDHFLDQSGLTGTQKAGVYINFCHNEYLPS